MSTLAPDSHNDNDKKSQFYIALEAKRMAGQEGKIAGKDYAPVLLQILKSHSPAEQTKIMIINTRYKLNGLLEKIDRYKNNIEIMEATGNVSIEDSIYLNNNLNTCESDINNFLEEISNIENDIDNSPHKENLDVTYQKLVDNINLVLEKLNEGYGTILHYADRLIPLS